MAQSLTRELTRFAPHAGAHRPALRCGISVAVPMLVLLVLGRIDLVGAAAFGSFTAIYGRDLAVPARTKVQALTGAGLVASVGIGVLAAHLPGAPWLALLVVVAVAGVGSLAGEMVGWKPGGPLFFVFATGAFVSLPPLAAGPALQVVATTAAAAAFSVAVGSAGAALRTHVRGHRPLFSTGAREALARGTVTEVVVACLLTAPLAVVLGTEHHYWALVAAVVPLTVSGTTARVARAVLRIAGTVAGLGVAAVLLGPELPAWAVVMTIIVLQAGAELFVLRHYAVALLFITPMPLLVSHLMSAVPAPELIVDRLLATTVGVAVALLVLAVRGNTATITGLTAWSRCSRRRTPRTRRRSR